MGIGIRLKKILDEKDVTLKELALMSDVSLNTLYGITKRDNETIKNDILAQIASTLNVPPQYILGLDDELSQRKEKDVDLFTNDFIDTEDGLLSEIIKISKSLTTKGRIKCLDYLKSIQNDNLNDTYKSDELQFKKWNSIRLDELSKMYEEKLIDDLAFQKLTLMLTKKLYLPYINDNDKFDQESEKLRHFIKEADQRLAQKNITSSFID